MHIAMPVSVSFAGKLDPDSIIFPPTPGPLLQVYELRGQIEVVQQEWMYELQAAACKTTPYDSAWQEFCKKQYARADEHLQRHLSGSPHDQFAQRLHGVVQSYIKEVGRAAYKRSFGMALSEVR